MVAIIAWITSGILGAWALISGATAVAGGALLTTALDSIPAQMGSAPAHWLSVINWYLPLNEVLSLTIVFFAIAAAMKFLKLSQYFKKR